MSIEKPDVVDAIGIKNETGKVVLNLLDAWDWTDEHAHLVALQSKLNGYFEFIESGQLVEAYPQAAGRKIIIGVIGRFPLATTAAALLDRARETCEELEVEIRFEHLPSKR
jgi:hypothetical protein